MMIFFSFIISRRSKRLKADAPNRRLGDVPLIENRQPVTVLKFISKNSMFIILSGVINRVELMPISNKK
jgi:hypothetical protein